MRMRATGLAIVACASLLAASHASAAERGFYVGGFFGQGDIDLDKAEYEALAWAIYPLADYQANVRTGSSFDQKDSNYGFFGGYRLFQNLAFEAGYIDLGEFTYHDQSSGIDRGDGAPVDLDQRLKTRIKGMSISALGILPLSYRSEVFIRGGVVFSSNTLSTHVRSSEGFDDGVELFSESDTDMFAGIGAGFTFAEIYTLRLEYQRIFDAGDEITGEGDADAATLSVVVSF